MTNLYIFDESSRATVYGIGTYIKELTAALKASEVHVCVVHLHSAINEKDEDVSVETDNIRHIHFPSAINWSTSIDLNKQRILYYKNVTYLLRLQIKGTEKLVFHLNSYQNGNLAIELKKTFNCKIITTIHYLDWSFFLSGNITHFRNIINTQATDQENKIEKMVSESYQKEKKYYEETDCIICLSERTRQILQDDYKINPTKTTVIYNGLNDINLLVKKHDLRQKYNIPDIPIFLFAGRLDEIKGLKYLFKAYKIVLNAIPQCHLIIAGNGAFDSYMKDCEDIWMHVTWTGLINKEKLYDLYSIADIGVMPSFHEQCSYVAIEMMMHGVPLIASTSTGLKEMVEDGVTGLHIPVVEYPDKAEIDTGLLAEEMLYLLRHPEERKRMGENARKRYEQIYSLPIMRRNMLDFYTSLFESEEKEHILHRLEDMVSMIAKSYTDYKTIGLSYGMMGSVVFLYHYARHTKDTNYTEIAEALMDKIHSSIHAGFPINYAQGLTGIGAAIEYLVQQGFIETDTDEILDDFDTLFTEQVHNRMLYLSSPDLADLKRYYAARLENPKTKKCDFLHQTIMDIDGLMELHERVSVTFEGASASHSFSQERESWGLDGYAGKGLALLSELDTQHNTWLKLK